MGTSSKSAEWELPLGSVDSQTESQRVERFKVERPFKRALLLPLVVKNGRSVCNCLNQLSGLPPQRVKWKELTGCQCGFSTVVVLREGLSGKYKSKR